MQRNSSLMHILRFFQHQYKYLWFIDKAAQPFLNRNGDIALLCILAPPRSGSTLTYQLLSSAFTGYSLRNISNFLFSTPIIGYYASKIFCRNYQSSFFSEKGFVSGLCGEAEGLQFWQYWLGQGLEQRPELLDLNRLKSLKKSLDKTGESCMITGYLGHVFSVSALREIFTKVLFIHVQRDLLSNAYSILRLTSEFNFFSICPFVVKSRKYYDRHRLVVDQINAIHSIIKDESDNDTIQISYEDICDNTENVLKKIEKKAQDIGIFLVRKEYTPHSFSKHIVHPDKDDDAARLQSIINKDSYTIHAEPS